MKIETENSATPAQDSGGGGRREGGGGEEQYFIAHNDRQAYNDQLMNDNHGHNTPISSGNKYRRIEFHYSSLL